MDGPLLSPCFLEHPATHPLGLNTTNVECNYLYRNSQLVNLTTVASGSLHKSQQPLAVAYTIQNV